MGRREVRIVYDIDPSRVAFFKMGKRKNARHGETFARSIVSSIVSHKNAI